MKNVNHPEVTCMNNDKQINILRNLACQLREIADLPQNDIIRKKWASHNELSGNTEPMLWVCPDDDGAWKELIPEDSMLCVDFDYRELEFKLRKYIYHYEKFKDDMVFEPKVYFDLAGHYTGYHYGKQNQSNVWGIDIESKEVGKNAYHLDNFIKTKDDFEKILQHEVDFVSDNKENQRKKEKICDAVGDILSVEFHLPYSVLVQSLLIELVHMRGMEELLYDLYDNDLIIMNVLEHMAKSKALLLDRLERNKMLFDNRINIYTGSGSLGYMNAQLKENESVKLADMWGFADAQEFSNVSPKMFEEFAIMNQRYGLNKFGMACYGCCEPLDNKFEAIFRHIKNIRRLSVSPWSDIELAAEKINDRAIYSWKPNPAIICCGFEDDSIRSLLNKVSKATSKCTTEIILKDIRTCSRTPQHIQRFIELTKNAFNK